MHVDPKWRRLDEQTRQEGKREFLNTVAAFRRRAAAFSYSTVGLRSDCDLMLWRISDSLETFQDMSARLLNTGLGRWMSTPYSYVAMTRRSEYVDEHMPRALQDARLRIKPTDARYIFVYPFVKTRDWYMLDQTKRQEMMNVHIAIGHTYPSVKLNTTYSFGLDDQEFVVAFETDEPGDFLDLVMDLRKAESSLYTLRDTPIFTCIKRPLAECLDLLDGVRSEAETPVAVEQ
jgi:chlorite dismutase